MSAVVCSWLGAAALLPGAAQAGIQIMPLTTSGNHIVRAGAPFNFYGVARDTLEWGQYNWGGCAGDGHFAAADWNAIASWQGTAVRIPLSQADWLGRRCSATAYASYVDAAIKAANARGMYAILDLHWTDVAGQAPCDPPGCTSGEQDMPDGDTVTFWKQVAARYASNSGVIFELFNEPHWVSWPCWRDGGCRVQANTNKNVWYQAVGMQTLVDAVRATGAQNLILAGGLDWAYDLSGVINGYALSGANIAYVTHIYTFWHNTPADLNTHVGYVADKYPVTSTEFGNGVCDAAQTLPLLQYLYAPNGNPNDRISWTAWSWNAPGDCTMPSIIANWAGTPLPGQGALIWSALRWLAGPGPGEDPYILFGSLPPVPPSVPPTGSPTDWASTAASLANSAATGGIGTSYSSFRPF